MVIAYLALFIALGGASYAALSIPRNSVGTAQLKRNAVTSGKVKNRSLRAIDFATGVLLRASQFYDKAASDARFLGLGATAANASQLGGVAASGYARGTGSISFFSINANAGASFDRNLPTAAAAPLGTVHLTCSDPATSGSVRVDVPNGRIDVVIITSLNHPGSGELLTGPVSSAPSSLSQNDRVGIHVESTSGGVADRLSADLYFSAGLGGNPSCGLVGFVTTDTRP